MDIIGRFPQKNQSIIRCHLIESLELALYLTKKTGRQLERRAPPGLKEEGMKLPKGIDPIRAELFKRE
jgi:hypothetical protein